MSSTPATPSLPLELPALTTFERLVYSNSDSLAEFLRRRSSNDKGHTRLSLVKQTIPFLSAILSTVYELYVELGHHQDIMSGGQTLFEYNTEIRHTRTKVIYADIHAGMSVQTLTDRTNPKRKKKDKSGNVIEEVDSVIKKDKLIEIDAATGQFMNLNLGEWLRLAWSPCDRFLKTVSTSLSDGTVSGANQDAARRDISDVLRIVLSSVGSSEYIYVCSRENYSAPHVVKSFPAHSFGTKLIRSTDVFDTLVAMIVKVNNLKRSLDAAQPFVGTKDGRVRLQRINEVLLSTSAKKDLEFPNIVSLIRFYQGIESIVRAVRVSSRNVKHTDAMMMRIALRKRGQVHARHTKLLVAHAALAFIVIAMAATVV